MKMAHNNKNKKFKGCRDGNSFKVLIDQTLGLKKNMKKKTKLLTNVIPKAMKKI